MRPVCADAAVSGTLACRRGYAIAKTLVERRAKTGAAWFLIDDLSRMSRNTIESLRLGELAAEPQSAGDERRDDRQRHDADAEQR